MLTMEQESGETTFSLMCKRSVTFDNTVNIGIAANWSQEDQNDIWFQPNEIENFKSAARELSTLLDAEIVVHQFNGNITESGEYCYTRGLERNRSLRRIQNKIMAKRVILKAQKRFQDPHKIALVANKCTEWSREIATLTGKIDYYEANEMFLPTQIIPVHPFETETGAIKRQISQDIFSMVKRRRKISFADRFP